MIGVVPPPDGERVKWTRPVWWLLGSLWRHGYRWDVHLLADTVFVQQCRHSGPPHGSWRFPDQELTWGDLRFPEGTVAKFISKAVVTRSRSTKLLGPGDPWLFKGRPAIEEFMTELESVPGTPREPSIIMVTTTVDGFRVGLKDDDADGWVWRECSTVAEGLDAIEKALASGVVKWTGGAASKRRKRP